MMQELLPKKKQENKKTPKTGENPEPQANIKTEEF